MSLSIDRKRTIQRLLAAAGYYNGANDGVFGIKSTGAINRLLTARAGEVAGDASKWSQDRRAVAAAQLILKHAGYDIVGSIDGRWGNLTEGAYLEWDHARTYGVALELDRTSTGAATPARAAQFPTQAQCSSFYGSPGSAVKSQLVMVDLPFTMRIDYNLGQKSTRVQLHRKCSESALAALRAIVQHYGEARLKQLGLDRNAGTYNHRRMRGGSSWSMHAYGCAWDFYAQPNGLTTRCPQALFCRPEYQAFFDIWEAHGWVSLGRAIGRDWMHVQAARL